MLRFSANLSFLYPEYGFADRFAAAARDGFRGVEYMSPYDEPAAVIAERLAAHHLEQVLFNTPSGDWAAGERGIACLPDRIAEFREGVDLALDYAGVLGCRRLNVISGILPDAAERAAYEAVLIDNLGWAAARCAARGVRLLFEPINRFDMPGFIVSTAAEAERVLAAVAHPNLFLQYDVYHMQRMQGELTATLERLLPRIAHVQIADVPGRHEPGTGEINYAFVLGRLDGLGYDGWVGCEYRPMGETSAGLDWMQPWR